MDSIHCCLTTVTKLNVDCFTKATPAELVYEMDFLCAFLAGQVTLSCFFLFSSGASPLLLLPTSTRIGSKLLVCRSDLRRQRRESVMNSAHTNSYEVGKMETWKLCTEDLMMVKESCVSIHCTLDQFIWRYARQSLSDLIRTVFCSHSV